MARKRQTEILALIALVLFAYGCSPSTKSKESGAPLAKSSDAKPNKPTQQKSSESVPSRILFEEVQVALGVNHAYQNGEQGKLNFCESFGGGSGWIDYDRDGNWDLYLNQGGDSTQADSSGNPLDQLFRNRGGQFENVTILSCIRDPFYSQGVAIADFNNDGSMTSILRI